MDLDYMYYKKVKKRQRERNWDRNEKKALIRLVQRYRPIIDNKGNDNVWIRRKNAAWEAIQRGMVAEGFRRGIKSVRSQWARTKGDAKKKQTTTKVKNEKIDLDLDQEEDNSTTDVVPLIPDADPLDCIIKTEKYESQEMMHPIIDDCDKIITQKEQGHDDVDEIGEDDNSMLVESILNSIPSPSYQQTESSGIGSSTHSTNYEPPPIIKPSLPPPRLTERKLLPKTTSGRNVLHARLRQIEEESVQKDEMHALEVAHRQEIHALRVQQMREQIEQQRRLFEAQMAKLQSS